MYQIIFTYVASENGTVTGTTTEVVTVQELVRDANGLVIEAGDRNPASPTQPSTVKANDGYYFLNWHDGSIELKDDAAVKARSYGQDTTFTAFFRENPYNAWTAVKRVTNLPARGYFRVGEEAQFTITVTNTGNRPLTDMKIQETLEGAVLRVPENSGYTVEDGVVTIGTLAPGVSVTVEAAYTVTRNDLFNRNFRNIVRTTATVDNQEPGENPDSDPTRVITADSGTIPAGAQGGGSSSGGGGGGGGSSTRSPGTGGGPGAAGTVTIDPEAVPLANLPDMGNDDILALIDDEEVPLAALPKTGQTGSAALMLMLSSMMLAAFAVVTRKKEDEQ